MTARSWKELSEEPATKWSVWKYHWLIHHQSIVALERAAAFARGTLVDVGCGARPFAPQFAGRVERYIGSDLRSSEYLAGRAPDVYARAEALPFRDGSAGTVFGFSMMTYLPEPLLALREARRVLEPGGHAILEFTQMVPLHDEPHDYFRFTRSGASWLLEQAGLEPVELIPIGGLWTRVGLTMTGALNAINRGPTRVLTEIPVRILYVVLQLGFLALDRLFFDPREVVAHLAIARKPTGPAHAPRA